MPRTSERYVIFDPAKNLVVGKGEGWTRKQAERFVRDHADKFSRSVRVEREGTR